MSTNDKLAATFHPHSSYEAVEAAWDPDRRQKLTDALARSIDQHTPAIPRNTKPAWAGDIAQQRRPRT